MADDPTPTPTPTDPPADPPADPPPPAADAGSADDDANKVRDAELAALHRESGAYRRQLREKDQRIAELERAGQSEQERAVADARKETEEQVRGEYDAKLRASALRAAGAGVLHDPEDAVRYIDADTLGDDEAKWGEKARKAVEELLAEREYLSAANGDAGGARGLISGGGRGTMGDAKVEDDWLRKAARRR